MTTPVAGFPPDRFEADVASHAVTITLDAAIYPLDAVYAASYVFLDRCFVLIDQPSDGKFRVTLSTKKPASDADTLRAMAGEFANELLSSAFRNKVTHENRALIEALTTQALSGAMGPPSLDDLANFDFSTDAFDDPLGIAMSWEEKYKKGKDAAPAPATEAKPPSGDASGGNKP